MSEDHIALGAAILLLLTQGHMVSTEALVHLRDVLNAGWDDSQVLDGLADKVRQAHLELAKTIEPESEPMLAGATLE